MTVRWEPDWWAVALQVGAAPVGATPDALVVEVEPEDDMAVVPAEAPLVDEWVAVLELPPQAARTRAPRTRVVRIGRMALQAGKEGAAHQIRPEKGTSGYLSLTRWW